MTAQAPPKDPHASVVPATTSTGWASSALLTAAVVAVAAKISGVVIAPGLRGLASQKTMDVVDVATAALAYTLTGLLVALLCTGSFELARARRIGLGARSAVVALSGLVVALASPAVVTRLPVLAALVLSIVTGLIALLAGIVAMRTSHTRAVATVLVLLALAGLVRPFAWEAAAIGGERASLSLFDFGVVLAAIAVIVQTLAALLSATWLATRSLWRGRILANAVVIFAFALTYVAARDVDGAPGALEAAVRAAFRPHGGVQLPGGIASIAAFLVPVSMLLALVTLVQRAQPAAVLAALSLALLSHGSFDVPLQALAIVVSAEWLMLASADDRGMWSSLARSRTGPRPPRDDQRSGV
jgi:hypothetical protein